MGSSNETKAMQVGGRGWDPPFSPSTFPPQYDVVFGGMEEVEACLQSRAGLARRNILLPGLQKCQAVALAAPILCPGGGPEGMGMVRAVRSLFHFTYEDINAQRPG